VPVLRGHAAVEVVGEIHGGVQGRRVPRHQGQEAQAGRGGVEGRQQGDSGADHGRAVPVRGMRQAVDDGAEKQGGGVRRGRAEGKGAGRHQEKGVSHQPALFTPGQIRVPGPVAGVVPGVAEGQKPESVAGVSQFGAGGALAAGEKDAAEKQDHGAGGREAEGRGAGRRGGVVPSGGRRYPG